ncbi:MAG: hypothetical protein ACRDOJ_11930 [Nocardioidaceae bacterium]
MEDTQLQALTRLVDRQAAARARVETNAAAQVVPLWARFDGWYDDGLIAELALMSAAVVQAAREVAGATTAAYVAQTVGLMRETVEEATRVLLPAARGQTSLPAVYTRPAKRFRYEVSRDSGREVAAEAAQRQVRTSTATDVMLAVRDAAQQSYEAYRVRGYRRVIHPERSEEGTCGLCAVASDRIYKRGDLAPLHGGCRCESLPLTDTEDPGRSLNEAELKDLYARAGSTAGSELRRVKYKVVDHGELGPTLAFADHTFRGESATVRSAVAVAERLVRDAA